MNLYSSSISDSTTQTTDAWAPTGPIRLHLNSYVGPQYAAIDTTPGIDSQTFDSYPLVPFTFAVEQAGGYVGLNPTDAGVMEPDPLTLPYTVPILATSLPGRDTTIPIFLNDSMFTQNTASNTVSFTQSQFALVDLPSRPQYLPASGKLLGVISDMVQFDITHIPSWDIPTLSVAGQTIGSPPAGNPATHFYFSGDVAGMSDDTGSAAGNFNELTLNPTFNLVGYLYQPSSIPSQQYNFAGFPGIYTLQQPDPSDLSANPRKIPSFYGRWRTAPSLINLSNTKFDIIIFPNTGENYTQALPADAIAIVHNGSTITNMYAGSAYFNTTDGTAPMVRLFPLQAYVTGTTAYTTGTSTYGEVDYTLSNFVTSAGSTTTFEPDIRNGSFSLVAASAGPVPSGFPSSGTFVVFR